MAKQNKSSFIAIKNISKVAENGTRIFSGLTASMDENKLTLIKGPSGCGKTTLLRIIAGLEYPSLGSIWIGGKHASAPNKILIPPHKRNIGFLFQDLALWPHMSGDEQIRFVWESSDLADSSYIKLRDDILDSINFPRKLLSRYPHELSRGQQQRLAIARAAVAKPRLLLLDEPFTGLDIALRDTFTTFLNVLKAKKKTTIVLVSHDLIQNDIAPHKTITFGKDDRISTD